MALSRITEVVTSFTDLTIGDDLTLTDDFLMASDASIIKFGADADVTLTHVHNTGLLLNSTSVIQFNDSSQNIGAPNATTLDINATDEIELNATLIDVNGNLDVSGTIVGASTISGTTITASTAFVPDASDGAALGTAALEFSDLFLADGGQILFGDDQEITLSHNADNGLILKHVGTGDGIEPSLTFQAGDTDIAANDVLGSIFFQAPDEGAGTDAILIAAGIEAVSEGDFSASNNATKLSFLTAASELASEKMSLSSAGLLTVADDIVFKDGGTIGVTSAVDAMTVSSGGIVTFKDDILIKDGGTIGSASDADAITIAANGQLTLTQTLIGTALDISGDIDVDGTTNLDVVDIDGAVDMASTLQVDGAITSSAGATITTADNTAQLTLTSTDADANSGPLLVLNRDSGSPADSDSVGLIQFKFDDDAGESNSAAQIQAKISDASNSTEDGTLEILTLVNGSSRKMIKIKPTEVVINEDSQDVDFRVEGNGDANLLFVDAGNDKVGIGTNTPDTYSDYISSSNSPALVIAGTQAGLVLTDTDVSGNDGTFGITKVGEDTTLNNLGAGAIKFSNNGGERLRLTSDGLFGVGTSNPTLDSSLAGVSVASGSAMVQVHNASGAIVKVSDPDNGSNRGGQFAQIGTTTIVNNCESGSMLFGTGNTLRMTIDANGHITMPTQSAFLVHPSGTQSDFPVGSQTQVNFGTERFDQNADFSSNTFTAPVSGRYQLSYSMYFNNVDSDTNYYQSVLSTSNKAYYAIFSATSLDQDAAYWNTTQSLLVDMDANDTAFLSLQVDGGTAQTDLTVDTYFSGILLA